MRTLIQFAASGCLCFAASLAVGDEWSQFRGPTQSGVADGSLPTEWSQEAHLAWKIKVPGVAWSQPIVWGDKLYVTTAITEDQPKPSAQGGRGGGGPGRGGRPRGGEGAERPDEPPPEPRGDRPDGPPPKGGAERPQADPPDGAAEGNPFRGFGRGGNRTPPDVVYRWEVHCLDRATGSTVWSQKVAEHKPTIPTHRTNTYASETPVTDGKHVFAFFGMTGLYCFTMDGEPVWNKDLGSYPMMNGWGTGSSPVLVDGLLFIQCDNEEDSFLVALDKSTGEEKWRVKRDERSTWGTPYVWKNKQRTELVTGGSNKIRSYDPATGKILWELGGISGRSASTAVGDDEMVYFGTGGGMGVGPLIAMKAGAEGELDLKTASEPGGMVAWSSPRGGPPMASPLLYDGLLYILDQRGAILTCYDAKTGEVAYKERLPGATGFTASPWASGGKIFCLDGEGTTYVLAAGKEFKVLGQNKLGEMCWSSPAIADDMIYLRTVDFLYCIKQ